MVIWHDEHDAGGVLITLQCMHSKLQRDEPLPAQHV
jgi:hypothetical protein